MHCDFFFSPLLVSYEAAGLLWMSGENGHFVHNYVRCRACTVRSMCRSRVHAGVLSSAFVCIMLWPTQVLRPRRKSIANNSTATGEEPRHPRGLWDRVYKQSTKCGRVKSVRVTLCCAAQRVQLFLRKLTDTFLEFLLNDDAEHVEIKRQRSANMVPRIRCTNQGINTRYYIDVE